jgi:hypothetical protein
MAHQNPQPEPRLQHGWTDHEKALAAAGGGERAGLVADMTSVAVYYATHLDAPLPPHVVMNIPIPPGTDEARHAAVDEVARDLGVHTETKADGCYMASRHFGGVTVEAHFTPAAAQVQNHQRFLHGEAA